MLQDEIVIVIDPEEIKVVVDESGDTQVTVEAHEELFISVEDALQFQNLVVETKVATVTVEEVVDPEFIIEATPDVIILAGGNVGPPGPIGETGPASTIPGPQGPPGPGATTYIHNQVTLAATWVITHNLGWFPAVSVVDTGGSEIQPNVIYNSDDQITLQFGAATSGKAYLNPGAADEEFVVNYLHTQGSPALVWSIVHNLNRYPSVTISDTGFNEVVADVHYVNLNELQITFLTPTAGRAYLV